jgi:hypothetical protein
MISKYLSISTFLISLSLGLLLVYLWGADMHEVYVFPTPENVMRVQYKDTADNCYAYEGKEVTCPTDETKISEYPIQK